MCHHKTSQCTHTKHLDFSGNKAALTRVHSNTVVQKTEHVAAPQLWPLFCQQIRRVKETC